MSSKPAAAVLWGKLAWHPAVVAWRGLAEDPPDPEHIEVLRQGKKSATYRLGGAAPGGRAGLPPPPAGAGAPVGPPGREQTPPPPPRPPPRRHGLPTARPPCPPPRPPA